MNTTRDQVVRLLEMAPRVWADSAGVSDFFIDAASRLETPRLARQALEAGQAILRDGAVQVSIAPGDLTLYELIVISPRLALREPDDHRSGRWYVGLANLERRNVWWDGVFESWCLTNWVEPYGELSKDEHTQVVLSLAMLGIGFVLVRAGHPNVRTLNLAPGYQALMDEPGPVANAVVVTSEGLGVLPGDDPAVTGGQDTDPFADDPVTESSLPVTGELRTMSLMDALEASLEAAKKRAKG